MWKIIYALMYVVLFTGSASCQTESETANYVLLGEHNVSMGTSKYTQKGTETGETWKFSKKITQDGICKYTMYTHWTTTKSNGDEKIVENIHKYDLNKIAIYSTELISRTGNYMIMFEGQEFMCGSSTSKGEKLDLGCRNKWYVGIQGDLNRWEKAFAYLRTRYCKGRAF